MNPLLMPWLAEIVLIAYRSYSDKQQAVEPVKYLPVPADFTATFIIFGALAFIPGEQLGKLAVWFGWGVVLATFLDLWDPTTGKVNTPSSKQQSSAASEGEVLT